MELDFSMIFWNLTSPQKSTSWTENLYFMQLVKKAQTEQDQEVDLYTGVHNKRHLHVTAKFIRSQH